MQPSLRRPHRLRGQTACLPCRQRKSKCTSETSAGACHMCRFHQTECIFPPKKSTTSQPRSSQSSLQRTPPAYPGGFQAQESRTSVPSSRDETAVQPSDGPSPLDEVADCSPHVVGPALSQDSHVLENYLASIEGIPRTQTSRRAIPGLLTGPITFSRVKKRPLGSSDSNHATSKLQMIEKLLEPWESRIIDLYFEKANSCFPIIDEASFRAQYKTAKHRLSPAMLACLYANALIYWKSDPELSAQRQPDIRYIWNLALDALYSELHLYPGSPTIAAILLDITGRPNTTVIGNGALIGTAISLAYGLGLNRDPSSWNIPHSEKSLRIHIWWCLVIYDRLSSFAHGTPPHIRSSHHDVPYPSHALVAQTGTGINYVNQGSAVFAALASLSEVLDLCLERMYRLDPAGPSHSTNLSLALSGWVDTLKGDIRRLILRGTNLDLSGAGNLRLVYLATKFLIHKIEFDAQGLSDSSLKLNNLEYVQTRKAAEDIVLFVQELGEEQLNGFWLGISACIFTLTATFLIRSAVETDLPMAGLGHSQCLTLAQELIISLCHHHEQFGWEIGELCVEHYADVIEKLCGKHMPREEMELQMIPSPTHLVPVDNLPTYLDYFVFDEMVS